MVKRTKTDHKHDQKENLKYLQIITSTIAQNYILRKTQRVQDKQKLDL